METSACYTMTSSVDFIGSDQFALFDGGMTLQGCEVPQNNDFADWYIVGFFDDHYDEVFYYAVEDIGTDKMLTITNAIGSQAIYGNATLATDDYRDTQFFFIQIQRRGY